MDYINYVKEYPVQGVTGLWGGVQGALQQAAGGEPVPDGSTFFGDRMLIAGGATPSSGGGVNTVEYGNITSSAASVDFGDLLNSKRGLMGATDSVRGIVAGGRDNTGAATDMIQYKVIPGSTADAIDFGNLTPEARSYGAANSDGTRAVFLGGGGDDDFTGHSNGQIITTQTLGNATVCGSLPANRIACCGASNGTRGIVAGGSSNAQPNQIAQEIYYFTMASFGSGTTASEFGSLHAAFTHGGGTQYAGACANSSRMIYMMGATRYPVSPQGYAVQQQCVYITVDTTGNASDFGDNQDQPAASISGFGNSTRGGFAGGYGNSYRNSMKYFTYATLSNSSEIGDLVSGDRSAYASMSGAVA